MKITSTEEYGLRCLLVLARHREKGPLTIPDIAGQEGLSLPLVSKIMGVLREAGLVESVRGRSGGYVLPRPSEEIPLSEVLKALGGVLLEPDHCEKWSGEFKSCVHAGNCSILTLWQSLAVLMDQLFRKITLADLAFCQAKVAQRLQIDFQSAPAEEKSAKVMAQARG